jgi:hypothetical protein
VWEKSDLSDFDLLTRQVRITASWEIPKRGSKKGMMIPDEELSSFFYGDGTRFFVRMVFADRTKRGSLKNDPFSGGPKNGLLPPPPLTWGGVKNSKKDAFVKIWHFLKKSLFGRFWEVKKRVFPKPRFWPILRGAMSFCVRFLTGYIFY